MPNTKPFACLMKIDETHFIAIWLLSISLLLLPGLSPAQNPAKVYRGQQLQSLRVPIGGIGTGDILIGGRGNIAHIEVFNRPDRQRRLEKTGFAIWCQSGDGPAVAKLLEREIFPPYGESTHKYVAGLPRFREAEFINDFPLHRWQFRDEAIPLKVNMEAFSPFVPLDVAASSYPVVAFYWDLENPTDERVRGSVVFNLENPILGDSITNRYHQNAALQGVRMANQDPENVNYQGQLFIGTTAADPQIQTHWYPGTWRDEAHIFWDDFSKDGRIETQLSDWTTNSDPASYNESTHRMASVLVPFDLAPGERTRIPFYLSWYFPQRVFRLSETFGIAEAAGKTFGNAYSNYFSSELDALSKLLQQEDHLYTMTARFAERLQHSTYPESVKEALSTQAATLRTNLIQVSDKGNVHGFEGVNSGGWCCPGTCTHVWNYEQTLASLFPPLERNMREIEFLHNTFDNGFQAHRSVLPIGDYYFNGPAAADGQMGTVVRAYREWKLSGDDDWLAGVWPGVKKALEFAWYGPGTVSEDRHRHQEKQMAWDPDQNGILTGRQHNTYDINFYGPSSMTTSVYLAALKAGAAMAAAMGDEKSASAYREVYEKGIRATEKELWNGEYFIQTIGDDPAATTEYEPDNGSGASIPKYQYGDGCLSDQLLGQYLAFISGLGYLLDTVKVNSALHSIYRYNFIPSLREFSNVQRVYGLNDESGVVLCTWPNDNRPALPFVYSDEIWTGVEFQVAASLIYAGYTEEGLDIVRAVQDRYDGFKRNPFEHDESGVHYARAMASWSVLLALSGIDYDGQEQRLTFGPRINAGNFSTFWSTGTAWGSFDLVGRVAVLTVDYGELTLRQFGVRDRKIETYPSGKQLRAGEQLVLELR
ncbi:GH116 family glycosyl-hydrolase [Flavilitoribacter nigricans]|uniref:Glycosyl-hydrolase family 116 catalytic region domain-containing protein n=1 Tax=Flavilitoribacter nigricans (strain ATCC 23147 / DSM 23189 / NBRC 102662 / NCIMB 1420 / SS-2) TaxID=1122177 RepID=A0A2D0NJH4_FLAN2|nr:GH116 family glycosyl-hydrolase [Flavilitoribacter nigricans]PHN07883.1 hypothetical protein CRP01_03785 [Flavilitoribacter nigricans DSM 23189 = NBRC 102662]